MSDKSTKPARRRGAKGGGAAAAAKSPGRRRPRVGPDDILPEYDFGGARPNKYAARVAQGTNLVLLDPDVARAFPDAAAVNEALRALAGIAARTRPTRRSRSTRRTA
jgi:hypothetical protein